MSSSFLGRFSHGLAGIESALRSHCWGGDALHFDTSCVPLSFVEAVQLDEATAFEFVIFQCFSHRMAGIESELRSHCCNSDTLHFDTSHAPLCFVAEAQLEDSKPSSLSFSSVSRTIWLASG